MASDKIGIFILSLNEIEREGLSRIVKENGFAIQAVHRTVEDLEIDHYSSDVSMVPILLLDQAMDSDGLGHVRDLKRRWPGCRIIVLANGCDNKAVVEAFQAGIDAYIGKNISCASLTEIIKLVALGEKIVPYQVVLNMPAQHPGVEPADHRLDGSGSKLSDRQIDILRGLARGEPNKVISRRLAITEATVKVHVKSILRRIGVANRTQAAVWAIEAGLLSSGGANDPDEPEDLGSSAVKLFRRNGACLA